MQVLRSDDSKLDHVDGRPAPLELSTPVPAEALEHPLVLVEWHDAWFELDEAAPQHRRLDYPVRTVGFLIGDGPSVLSLAQEVLPDAEGFRAVTHIPLPIVKRVVHLEAAAP